MDWKKILDYYHFPNIFSPMPMPIDCLVIPGETDLQLVKQFCFNIVNLKFTLVHANKNFHVNWILWFLNCWYTTDYSIMFLWLVKVWKYIAKFDYYEYHRLHIFTFCNSFYWYPNFFFRGFNEFPDFDTFFTGRLEPRARRRDDQRSREQRNSSLDPYRGGMNDIFGSMNQMMAQMHRQFDDVQQQMKHVESGPDSHCYSSTTFYSYDGRGKEPHIYQAHSSTRTAPGGIKETQKAVKDSRSGEQKMAIGKHIHDRGVIREKRRNVKTKEEDEREDLIGFSHGEIFLCSFHSCMPARQFRCMTVCTDVVPVC